MRFVRFAWFAFAAMFLSAHARPAAAEDISGRRCARHVAYELTVFEDDPGGLDYGDLHERFTAQLERGRDGPGAS